MEVLDLNHLFGGAYVGRNVLVTGHTGFKGSWLCLWLQALGANVCGLALAPETTPSHWDLLGLQGVRDLRVDLRDGVAVRQAVEAVRPDIVFHLAAQPLVRRSYRQPIETFDTNVLGLVHLLEAVRGSASVRALVNATTDKVYREHDTANGYREDDPLGGHDPYSTSKACAELVSACYRKSYFGASGPRSATARAGNVIGGGDWSEDRLVPDLVRAATSGNALRIRNPDAVRPWQHVLEPLSGYLLLGRELLAGHAAEGAWNFGPAADATLPVHALVAQMQSLWPGLRVEHQPDPLLREADILRLDCSKAAERLDWRPVWPASETIRRTLRWYRTFHEHGRLPSIDDLQDYVRDAHAGGLEWAT
ncbi:MAG: CDP-glucose 4,6-dehydratase [Proteobacteria bacterium]|nr:CDP-glucose 4,6-dehydratase [Pseudomonadota bacterium]